MLDPKTIKDHLAQPGPLYWGWRCLVCSEPVSAHVGLLAFVWAKLRRRA